MKHHPRNTVSIQKWCGKCLAHTPHRVDGGREGPCLRCIDRMEECRKVEPPAKPPAQEALKFS